ncbi:MAG: tetratricopeptide repeat protein [Kofleriaceae bacterium]
MIEATCSACGTLNRVAESDVPAGTKFVNCSSCMSKVALPGRPTSMGPLPIKPPAGMLPKVAPPKPPAVPKPPPVPSRVTPAQGSPIAPKPPAPMAIPAVPLPAPVAPAPALDFADLPAPKRPSALGSEPSRPAPKSGLASALDAEPRGAGKQRPGPLDLSSGGVDLPAPKSASGAVRAPSLADPPVPVPGGAAIMDLPAPKPVELADLPAPRGPSGIIDLPAPKGPPDPAASLFDDLTLTPQKSKQPAGRVEDGVAPKGFFDDLPAPAASKSRPAERASEDVAPKGFFDDLPQPSGKPAASAKGKPAARSGPAPASTEEVAPKGFFDDLPQPASRAKLGDDVAPKGFFDDLPQPAAKLGKPAPGDEVAPKGFFDDLPQPSNPASARSGGSQPARAPAPQGFFEELPQSRAKSSPPAPEPSTTLDLASELPSLELESSTASVIDPGPPAPEPQLPPSMGLAAPSSTAKAGESFDDLDLSKPSGSPVRFDPPKQKSASAATAKPMRALSNLKPGETPALEVEGEPGAAEIAARPAEKPDIKAKAEERAKAKAEAEAAKNARKRRLKLVGIATAGVLALGAGGFVFYQRHVAAQERADEIAQKLDAARKQMSDPATWSKAASSALDVVGLDESNSAALGIAAEASFASGLSNGQGAEARFAKGRTLITDALKVGAGGPALVRAQALSAIAAGQPAQAVAKLGELIKQSPADGTVELYLGWAHGANGDLASAIKAFDQAGAKSPAVKTLALLERARAKLALADIDGASADFAAVLAADPENIPAMVGLASTLPRSQSQQQESDLLAILGRKDIATADPRVVAQAWSLAGEVARLSGRLDVARERYRKALEVMPNDLAATTGMAEVELRAGKLDAATKLLSTVLTAAKNDANAQLVASELAIQQKNFDDAAARIQALAERQPPLPPASMARLQVVRGHLLDAQGKDDEAVAAYLEGAKIVGEHELGPTMAAVAKLSDIAKKTPARAAELKAKVQQLLGELKDRAKTDHQLAVALAAAYEQAGDAEQALPLLRDAAAARDNDPDANFLLGRVLVKLGNTDEGVERLQKAMKLAPDRSEIALELARTYEKIKRDGDAKALYDQVLAKEPSLESRGHAGEFYVRTGEIAKGAEQGAKILEVDHKNATGHYLVGEGQLQAGRPDEARKSFSQAIEADRTARYVDAYGRATEAYAKQRNNDLALSDDAVTSYVQVTQMDPTMVNPYAGQGRIYVVRREYEKAVAPLLEAFKRAPNDAEVAYNLGVAYRALDKKKVAVDWFAQSNKLKPHAETSWNLGKLYLDLERGPAAKAALWRARELANDEETRTGKTIPWLTEALHALGQVCMDTRDENCARVAWEQYVERKPAPGAKLDAVRRALATELRR